MRTAGGRLAPLAVAAVLALSGCGAFGLGGPGTDTLTPVSVDPPETPVPSEGRPTATATPTPEPDRPRSGGTLSIGDISELGATYATRLENRSYRLRETNRLRVDGAVVSVSTLTRRVAADGRYVERLNRTNDGLPGRNLSYTTFYNGSATATRYSDGTTTQYAFDADVRPPADPTGRGQLEGLLRGFELERRSNPPPADPVVFVGDALRTSTAPFTPVGTTDPRDGRLVFRLYGNGTATVRASYSVTVEGGRTGEVTRVFRADRLDSAPVEAPPWVAAARAG